MNACRRACVALVGGWLLAAPLSAQPVSQLKTMAVAGDITANGGAVTLSNTAGMASLLIQTTGTFSLTWEVQCSGDGTTFDADDEIPVSLVSSTPTPADAITSNAQALYTASIAGCRAVRVIATAFTSGTMTATLTAITSGGGSSGGSGGGGGVVTNAGTFPVQITQGGNTAAVNASSQLSVTCANCSGSGVSVLEDILAVTGDAGTPAYAVRSDTLTSTTSGNGDYQPLKTTALGSQWVTLANSAGTELVPSTDVSHDAAASASGPQVMGEATTAITADTAVADGDATRFKTDTLGRQIVVAGCARQDRVRGQATITDASSTSVLAALGANIIAEIYEIEIVNTSAVDVMVDIRDGTAGSVLWSLMAPATSDTGGGNNRTFTIPLTFTANTAVAADPSASATSIVVSVLGCRVL